MRIPLVALLAVMVLSHRPAYCQKTQTASGGSVDSLPASCRLREGEKNDHKGVDAIQRGMVREDERFMALLKTKEAVWQACVQKSPQCSCDMRIDEKGLGLACSAREKGIVRTMTQDWHVIGPRELADQFFAVEKAGDGYALNDYCLEKISLTGFSHVDMSWQAYNLAGELSRLRSEIRAEQVQRKLSQMSSGMK